MARETLRVIPLGGLGEVGRNMMALECAGDIIVIDAGVLFPEEDMLGIDFVIPDVSYLVARKDKVRAILITHGHEDHTGALPFVLKDLDVPVYAPRLAHGLIAVKLKEHRQLKGAKLNSVEPGKKLRFGNFTAEFFRVAHSIPDAMGIALQTPLGTVVHTGDFKIDHTPVDGHSVDYARLAQLSSQGIFLLFSDSTYAEIPGYTPSEKVVGETLKRVIGEAQGRVVVATFASLIARIQQVIDAAVLYNRRVAIVGRSMVDNVKMTMKMDYLSAPEGTMATLSDLKRLPDDQVVVVTTGSQGEPTSALVRMANKEQKDVQIVPGDTVIVSASPIPGNETLVSRTIDNLYRLGAKVFYHRNELVHVHGHASQEELKMMLTLTMPRYFVPVHGEYRHLVAHAGLARSLGIPGDNTFVLENGDVLELTEDGGRIAGSVPGGHVYVDGRRVWNMQNDILRERKTISRDGILLVVLPFHKGNRGFTGTPKFISRGFVDSLQANDLYPKTSKVVVEALERDGNYPQQRGEIDSRVKNALVKFLYQETGRTPLIVPVSIEV